jgi:protein-S-isoprenylcysteine O-methyltransferase Ste14
MNTELIFRLIAGFSLLIAFSTSVYFRHRAEREGGKLERPEGSALLVALRLLGLAAILPLLLYLIQPAWVAWARIDLPPWLRWVGVVGLGVMLPLLYWMFAALGASITPVAATRQNHQLVTNGPYRWIRHPLYTFGSLFFLSLTLVTGLWWMAALLAVGVAVLVWRTGSEERNLMEQFGEDYHQYMRRTGRFLPRVM